MGALRTDEYRAWLKQSGLIESSVSTYVSDTKRVKECYGDLDGLYDENGLEGVLQTLQYSADERHGNVPNPTKIPIDGDLYKTLPAYRAAVGPVHELRVRISKLPADTGCGASDDTSQ